MSSLLPRLVAAAALAFFTVSIPSPVWAKFSEWNDPQKPGKTFRGEPVEVVGPFALFRTGATSGRRILLRDLSSEEHLRLYQETSKRKPRAAQWSQAEGVVTRELLDRASRVQQKELVPVDFSKLAEPEWLLVIKGSQNDGASWRTVGALQSVYQRIQRVRPGFFDAVFFGVRHDLLGHKNIATSSAMPWLVANFRDQMTLSYVSEFAPAEGVHLTLLSRNGAPVLGAEVSEHTDLRRFVAAMTELVGFSHPDNPLAWPDRLAYGKATRPARAALGDLPVELLGNPLRPDVMRKYGLKRVAAQLNVDAQGLVTAITWDASSEFPEKMRAALEQTLTKSVPLLPAYKQGKPVPATFFFAQDLPALDPVAEAELAWLSGVPRRDIPLPEWLVLKPLPVEEPVFTGSAGGVDERGVVALQNFTVDGGSAVSRKTQLNVFNSDFFGAEGPGTLALQAGDKQTIDGIEYTWTKLASVSGFVDFREGSANCDYSVGYALAEFDSPSNQEAWLGLGSDDGVKIWLNGKQVLDKWTRRPSRMDDDIVPLTLRQGKNQLLIKIQNATGDWSYDTWLRTR